MGFNGHHVLQAVCHFYDLVNAIISEESGELNVEADGGEVGS
jgi:hypothetical protein